MNEMTDMERIFVADHIHELERDAVGVRGGHRRVLPAAPRGTASGPRDRVGRWLIGIGEAVAGRPHDAAAADQGDCMPTPV
jgi:hypothetical protein